MLSKKLTDKIIDFIKKEPVSVQEVSKFIQKSWVTTESYLQKIEDETGQIKRKVFRKGSQGALKIVYYNYASAVDYDHIKKIIAQKIISGRKKEDLSIFEILPFVKEQHRSISWELPDEFSHITEICKKVDDAEHQILIFSGNLSIFFIKENLLLRTIERVLERGVSLKILCRIDFGTMKNLKELERLLRTYKNKISIHNCYQPLRGMIIDEKEIILTYKENPDTYHRSELENHMHILSKISDQEWISWFTKMFWNLYNGSNEYEEILDMMTNQKSNILYDN